MKVGTKASKELSLSIDCHCGSLQSETKKQKRIALPLNVPFKGPSYQNTGSPACMRVYMIL